MVAGTFSGNRRIYTSVMKAIRYHGQAFECHDCQREVRRLSLPDIFIVLSRPWPCSQRSTPVCLNLSLQDLPCFHSSHAKPKQPIHTPPKRVNVHPTPMASRNVWTRAVPPPARRARTILFAAWTVERDLGCTSIRSVPHI